MPRTVEQPTVVRTDPVHGTTYAHPAYGQIAISRVSGGNQSLHGSDFSHQHYMVLRIHQGHLNRHLNQDWYHADMQAIVEVAMSEAQWATFVSSPNQGSGVPCTIQRRDGASVPELPAPNQVARFHEEAASDLSDIVTSLQTLRVHVEEGTAGLSKAKAASLLAHVDLALRRVNDSLPFVAKQMDEHMENTVEKAKVEVHGYINAQIARAGLQALGGVSSDVLALPAGQETSE